MKELTLTFKNFENCCRYYNKDNIYRNINQICFDQNYYGIATTFIDDYFYLRVYVKNIEIARELKKYYKDNGYYVYGEIEQYGRAKMNAYFNNHEYNKHIPEGLSPKELTQTEINKIKSQIEPLMPMPRNDFGQDEAGTYFTLVPISKNLNIYTFVEFLEKEQDHLLAFAKKNETPIMFRFMHVDNVIHGGFFIADKELTGLETNNGFVETTIEAMFHNARSMFISACILKQFCDNEEQFEKTGCKLVYSQIKFNNIENLKYHKVKKFLE